jgi:hypothetical protein
MISKYNSFVEDMLLEKAINESFLYYSPNVRKALSRIKGNDIASSLLGSEGTDVKPDMTFIDLGKEGYFSFITMRNAKPLIAARYPNLEWADNIETQAMPDVVDYSNELHELDKESDRGSGVFMKSRNEVGLGRFVNKLFPGKYNSKEVEEFVNSFKASLEKAGEHFELVEGEDIEHWYWYENYKEKSGTLGSSCMSQKRNLFGIYTQNQDVCKLLILKEDDKIIGRALIWKLASIKHMRKDVEGVEYFMDRQYTIKDSDVQKFRNYANEQGWCYKTYNNHHSYSTVTINEEVKNVDMTVQVKDKDYNRYPYMDTFRRYDVSNGILHNDEEQDEESYEGQYILEDTGGGYAEIEGGYYSEWYDRRIPRDEAVWSDPLDSYLYEDRAVQVRRGYSRRRGWYPEDHDDIFYDEDHDEYFHIDDGVYSEIENRSLYDETAVKVVTEIFGDGDVPSSDDQYMYEGDRDITEIDTDWFWFDKISDKFSDWRDYRYISQKLLVVDYKGNYIPKAFATEVYSIEPRDNAVDITGVEYLTKADSLGLGYNIIESEKKIIDWFTYTETISEYTDILLERLPKLIDRYSDVLNNKGQLQLPFQGQEEQEYRDKISMNMALCQDRLEHLQEENWN